jgi:hypothetical protein
MRSVVLVALVLATCSLLGQNRKAPAATRMPRSKSTDAAYPATVLGKHSAANAELARIEHETMKPASQSVHRSAPAAFPKTTSQPAMPKPSAHSIHKMANGNPQGRAVRH